MTEREKRDAILVDVVRAHPDEWVNADTAQRGYLSRLSGGRMMGGHDPRYISAQGVGQILSRLAREGRLEKDSNGYMGYYRAPAERDKMTGVATPDEVHGQAST